MSKTSGISSEVLSLPKGGGAVQGLGTTFETDLNTGTGSFSIPLDAPAGPNAIQPRLMVRYHSAAGNAEFGMGWTLGQVTIGRTIEGRIPDYGPDDDAFTLVGVEALVPLGSGLYRPRVDTMHWRISRVGDGWELTDTSGMQHFLGRTANSRVGTTESGLQKTALWLLEEMRDRNGHSVRYTYREEGAQRYLERVEWGTYRLEFSYEARPDVVSSARYGFLIETGLRCRKVELHVTDAAPTLARSWTFDYEQTPGTGLSLLTRATLTGHGPNGEMESVPPLNLEYTGFAPRTLERFTSAEPGLNPGTFGGGRIELVDWDGDGLPDLLELGGGQSRLWPNRGRLRWDTPRSLPSMPTPVALDQPGVAFADMDSSGTADLIMLDRPLAGYYPLKPGGGFEAPVFWRQAPAARLADANARLMDLDGDGVIDLLVTTPSGFEVYLRDEQEGWMNTPRTIPRQSAPPVLLNDRHVHVADMNGDGLSDLVRVDGGSVTYYPYLGNGRWGEPVEMANPPVLPRQYEPERLAIVDIDGDGCADLVYVDLERVLYWLNQSGGALSEAHEIAFTPPAALGQFRIADMRGTGTSGVLWSAAGIARRGYLYLDFTGGVKPYLLSALDSGLGLRTEIDYRPSTEFALDDAESGRPWRTFHPFPVQCVAAIRLVDSITGQTSLTEHHYHEARYDPHTRTFLGFGVVDADSVGDAFIPTLRTRNTYHLGLDPNDPASPLSDEERLRLSALRRRLIRTEFTSPDGSELAERPFHAVQHTYETRLDPAADGRVILVPYERRTLEMQVEREAEPFAFREVVYDEPDAHGNITRQRMRAWRSDPGEATPDQDVTTETNFAKNLSTHNVSLPARVTQRDGDGNLLSATVTHYDGPPHVGLPEGQATTGDITRRQTLVLSDALATEVYGTNQPDWAALGYARRGGEAGWWATDVSYERAGDVLIVRGPRGGETRLEYDATGQFPARLTDAGGNVVTGTAEPRVFQMATATDANGHTTRDVFDALGRVSASIRAGESEAQPGVLYGYRTATLPVRSETRQRTQIGGNAFLDEYQYFDGRGEFIQRIGNGEGDAGRRFIVEEARQYTTRGQACVRYTPYYVDSIEYAPPPNGQPRLVMRFDAIARLIAQEKADGGRTTQAFVRNTIVLLDDADNAGQSDSPLVYTLDSLKRVIAVEHQLADRNVTQTYVFDAAGRTVRVTDAGGGETRYVYDMAGHILAETTPDTGTVRFAYDAAGNQVQRTLASGKTVRNRFDALERLIESRQDGEAEPEMAYTYLDAGDPAPPDGVRNRIGRPWQIQDRVGQITFAYDEQGRTLQTRRTLNAGLGGQVLVTDTAYDALGRVTRLTLPEPAPLAGRRVIDYRYNARGLPDNAPSYVQTAEYDVTGHLTRLVYANGAQNLLDYEPLTGRPARLQVLAGDGTTLRDQTFTYDAANNLERIDSPLALEAAQFGYDDFNQLLSAAYGNGDEFSYTYADGGNIQSIQALGILSTLSYDPNSGAVRQVNAPGGPQNYTYDVDGHLQSAPYGALHFDALDNLARADLTDGRTAEYVYDFMNRRAARRLSDGALFVTADESVEFQRGTPVQWITFAGRRILAIVNNIGAFLHHDLIGTPTLYTDGGGALLRRIALGPFGSVRFDSGAAGSATSPPGLHDQPLDGETGLICLGRRLYDPRLGRFISPDRGVGGMLRLDAWNRYVYAHNNPLRYVDPTGRFSWGDFFAILGVAIVVAALIVAGFFCAGATWAVAAGVVVSVQGLLIGTAVGIAAGAVLGGIAAGVAGGDIWAGVLLGGFLGGVAAFSGGILGAAAGGLAGSLFSGTIASYVSAGVSGLVQGALMGAATGFATGFAGGKGTAENMWTSMWKGAIIGAITGLLLGLASAYISSFNTSSGQATLRIGVDKLDPRVPAGGGGLDKASFIDSSLSTGQAIARNATGISPGAGIGTFVSVGTGPGTASLINIPIGWLPGVLQYGGIATTLATTSFVGLDKYNILEFGDVMIFILEAIPFGVGFFFTLADDANWGWFEDMKRSFQTGFSLPPPA